MLLKWWIKDLEGMSDLCMYKLKDNIWKDFTWNDDYLAPYHGDERWDLFDVQSDSLANSNRKFSFTNDAYNATKSSLGKEKVRTQTSIMKNTVLGKDSWPHTLDGVPTSLNGDSFKDVKTESSSHCIPNHYFKTDVDTNLDYCRDNHIVTDHSAADDNDMYQYSVSHMSQTDNDISFLDDDGENKENSDPLYYVWQDMESFEDVDTMFRNCDSTFGFGNLSNEDDLRWFSPSHGSEKLEEPSKLNLKFSCSEGSTINDVSKFNEDSNPVNSNPLSDGLNRIDILTVCKENDGLTDIGGSAAISHSLAADKSDRKRNCRGDLIPKKQESSYASELLSIPSSHYPSSDAPTIGANENKEKLYRQDLPASLNKDFAYMSTPNSERYKTSHPVRKQEPRSESEIDDGHSENAVSRGSRAELDSSNAQDKSCRSTVLDGFSQEATSFRQLQQVMEQLDSRTKLCIRDSLYRLARSAEQRHNSANLNENIGDDKLLKVEPPIDQDVNRNDSLLDLETDTNPIDRSVAHLLFHRPSDPSIKPAGGNALLMKPHKLVPAEKQNFREETGGADQKLASNG